MLPFCLNFFHCESLGIGRFQLRANYGVRGSRSLAFSFRFGVFNIALRFPVVDDDEGYETAHTSPRY